MTSGVKRHSDVRITPGVPFACGLAHREISQPLPVQPLQEQYCEESINAHKTRATFPAVRWLHTLFKRIRS